MKLFNFDVTLKDLMNLGERAQKVEKLKMLFVMLEKIWYPNKEDQQHRWNDIRIGSVDVYVDKDNQINMNFTTRFDIGDSPEAMKVLEHFKK